MKTVNIEIGGQLYLVTIANTEETRKKGLKNRESLADNKGMLFIWDSPQEVAMTMEDTLIPLDLIFINENNEVIAVEHRSDVLQDKLVLYPNTVMVLEVNINSGVEEGDELEVLDDTEEGKYTMKVLAPDGSTLMSLEGGERIFSRKNTRVLIRQAKKAYISKSESDYKRLGKSIFKYLNILESNDPEYVLLP